MAEAQQEAYGDSTQADQNNEKGNIEGAAQRLVVVEPGDSLWSITQERLGQGASPQQIHNEVERTFELNRELLGDDSDLILPGQELSLPPVAGTSATMPLASPARPPAISEPAAKPTPEPIPEATPEPTPEPGPTAAAPTAAIPKEEPVAGESSVTKAKAPEEQPAAEQPAAEQPAAEQPTEEEPATSEQGEEEGGIEQQSDEPSSLLLLPEASPTEGDPSSVASVEESLRSKLQDISRRQVGLVIFGLTFLVAIAMAWKLPMRRNLRDPQAAQRVHYLGQTNDHLSYRGGDGSSEETQQRASFERPDPDKPLHGSRVEALTKQNDIDRSEMIVVAAASSGRRKKVLSMRAPGERRLLRKRHTATAYDPYIRSSLRHSPGAGAGANNGQRALRRALLRTPLRARGRR
jgi:nucleoid-associated protein YgaU